MCHGLVLFATCAYPRHHPDTSVRAVVRDLDELLDAADGDPVGRVGRIRPAG